MKNRWTWPRILAALIAAVLTLLPTAQSLSAQQVAWLQSPAGGAESCAEGDRWLLLYWGGGPASIDQAARGCARADRLWSNQAGRWLGFSPAAPEASDAWALQTGEATFLHLGLNQIVSSLTQAGPATATPALTRTPTPSPTATVTATVRPALTATATATVGAPPPTSNVIDAAIGDAWPCYANNPSCRRDVWWIQWNEVQRADTVTFQFAPGLVSEYRYAEAIRLLAQWPEGLAMLREAGLDGVRIVSSSDVRLHGAVASFTQSERVIRILSSYRGSPTWMLADSLAHELKHAVNRRQNIYQRSTYSDCIDDEESAYNTEARFLAWLGAKMGGMPRSTDVVQKYSSADMELYSSIVLPLATGDIDGFVKKAYQQQCA